MRLLIALAFLAACAAAPPLPQADAILVLKAAHLMRLMRGGQVLKEYSVALGNPTGAKQREGDRKTPEGTYSIAGRNPKSAYHRSLRISYPSAEDRRRAEAAGVDPGGDIMIHGLPNGQGQLGRLHLLEDWTLGCIAVTDDEIEEIWRLVPDGTPITIHP